MYQLKYDTLEAKAIALYDEYVALSPDKYPMLLAKYLNKYYPELLEEIDEVEDKLNMSETEMISLRQTLCRERESQYLKYVRGNTGAQNILDFGTWAESNCTDITEEIDYLNQLLSCT